MRDRIRNLCAPFLLVMLAILCAGSRAVAEEIPWRVGKSSGEVWVTAAGVLQASLADGTTLKPGDNIRTGRNGRVLLVRGEETILISPNSAVGIPAEQKDGLPTTIIQQAGSVLIEVEKRNVKHFQVETPYLAAVVKGTQFRVFVNQSGAAVDVVRGTVDVADFRSGQHVLVMPGQAAKVSAQGPSGLSLSGSGALSPIEQGAPRKPSVSPMSFADLGSSPPPPIQQGAPRKSSVTPVMEAPKEGLSVPDKTPSGPRARVALSPGEVEWVPASSQENFGKENGWSDGLVTLVKGIFTPNGRGNSYDNIASALAIPFSVGFAVAIAVAVQRRRQRQKLHGR